MKKRYSIVTYNGGSFDAKSDRHTMKEALPTLKLFSDCEGSAIWDRQAKAYKHVRGFFPTNETIIPASRSRQSGE